MANGTRRQTKRVGNTKKILTKSMNTKNEKLPPSFPRPNSEGFWWRLKKGKWSIHEAKIRTWYEGAEEEGIQTLVLECGEEYLKCDMINTLAVDLGVFFAAAPPFEAKDKEDALPGLMEKLRILKSGNAKVDKDGVIVNGCDHHAVDTDANSWSNAEAHTSAPGAH